CLLRLIDDRPVAVAHHVRCGAVALTQIATAPGAGLRVAVDGQAGTVAPPARAVAALLFLLRSGVGLDVAAPIETAAALPSLLLGFALLTAAGVAALPLLPARLDLLRRRRRGLRLCLLLLLTSAPEIARRLRALLPGLFRTPPCRPR